MNAPDKIYVEVRHPFGNEFTEMLGFKSRGNSDDTEYIRKDLLLEWAKELASEPYDRTTESARKHQIAHYLLEKYNSL